MLIVIAAAQPIPPSLDEYLKNNNLKTTSTPEGLHYQITMPGKGVAPKDGEYVLIRFKAMLLDSTVFEQSKEEEPFIFQVGNREVIKGLDKAARLLKIGGKGTFYLPPNLGYMHFGVGKVVPPNSPLMYELELLDIMSFEKYDAYMRRWEEKEQMEHERREKEQFQKDLAVIREYAAAQSWKVKTTPSGLSYLLTKPGKGANAKPGQRIRVAYEGFLTNGNPFERSAEEKPYEFILGQGAVMDGWEEGLLFFNKGCEGWLLIPSKLAYGPLAIEDERVSIPANSVLLFKIRLVEILE